MKGLQADEELSSRQRELPPHALTEPDVTLSRHPPLVIQPLRGQEFANGQITVLSAEQCCSAVADFAHGGRAEVCASDATRIQAARQSNEIAYSTSPSDNSDRNTTTSPVETD